MDLSRFLKGFVAIVLIFVIWKYVIPWIKGEADSFGRSSNAVGSASASSPCISSSERASSAWGGGLGRYVNPPYDLGAWSSFKSDVDSKISQAESDCSCTEDSCRKARSAMGDLRGLVSDLDTAIRGGTSPGQDIVQRQEQVDRQIDDARELVRAGK